MRLYEPNMHLKLDELYEGWLVAFGARFLEHTTTTALTRNESSGECHRSKQLPLDVPSSRVPRPVLQPVTSCRTMCAAPREDAVLGRAQFGQRVCEFVQFPEFVCSLLFKRLAATNGSVSETAFRKFSKERFEGVNDQQRRFFNGLCWKDARWLSFEDILELVHEIVQGHRLLQFLMPSSYAPYKRAYAQTVAARILYSADRSRKGGLSWADFKGSNIIETLTALEAIEDINLETLDYFPYDHFYVIYCKFAQLASGDERFITEEELLRYADDALSERIVDRIWLNKDCGLSNDGLPGMTYEQFVWFIMSEEDKTNDASIAYWFRCLDLDQDGYLSGYELEYFWEEQEMTCDIPFSSIYAQILDMLRPKDAMKITQHDIRASGMAPLFFDTLFNKRKFIAYEQEPYAATKTHTSDWQSFCKVEYEAVTSGITG